VPSDARLPYSLLYPATPPPASYALSLHDALPIFAPLQVQGAQLLPQQVADAAVVALDLVPRGDAHGADAEHVLQACGEIGQVGRSEEHTSELQSRENLVCRLLLEKKKFSISHSSS